MVYSSVHRHAHVCMALFKYPTTACATWHAAQLWFQSDTALPAAHFRNQQFQMHCAGRKDSTFERQVRRDTFCQAFAEAIGNIVVEEAHLRAAPA